MFLSSHPISPSIWFRVKTEPQFSRSSISWIFCCRMGSNRLTTISRQFKIEEEATTVHSAPTHEPNWGILRCVYSVTFLQQTPDKVTSQTNIAHVCHVSQRIHCKPNWFPKKLLTDWLQISGPNEVSLILKVSTKEILRQCYLLRDKCVETTLHVFTLWGDFVR